MLPKVAKVSAAIVAIALSFEGSVTANFTYEP
jgi:hypothetical protein